MKTLEKNISNLCGQKGRDWINALPSIVKHLSQHWSLTDIKPVKNMSWNYVATAVQHGHDLVVLKISCDKELIRDEYKTLQHFNGQGAIKVLDINAEHNALLLEQAVPGYLLKELHPKNIIDTIHDYTDVVKKLATVPITDVNDFTHVSKWCAAFDRITDARVEKRFIEKAQALKTMLLGTAKQEYLCHGDLHLENIIKHGSDWLVIDPKGIIGEMAFEAAAFDLIDKENMQIIEQVQMLANALRLDFKRLLAWVFLRIIMSAQWFIEDNGDPSHMLKLANDVEKLLFIHT